MDGLCVINNGILQVAVELLPSAAVGLDLSWHGSPEQGIVIFVTRTDELCQQERWKDLQIAVGDEVSFFTSEVELVEKPIECLTDDDLINLARSKPKMEPGKVVRRPLRKIGVADVLINNTPLLSYILTNGNMLSLGFVWLGDRSGASMLHVSAEAFPTPIIPKIAFGDVVTVRVTSP